MTEMKYETTCLKFVITKKVQKGCDLKSLTIKLNFSFSGKHIAELMIFGIH